MTNTVLFNEVHQLQMNGESLRIGMIAIEVTPQSRIEKIQFKYRSDYLANSSIEPISPLMGSIKSGTYTFPSDGHSFVGFIDDLLPDDWGKKIIAKSLGKRHVTNLTAIDFIGSGVSIGANKITNVGGTPNWSNGVPIEDAERTIKALFNGEIDSLSPDELEAIHIVQGGSQVGGARPKMLVIDGNGDPCVIKPNQSTDKYDHATLEWASLEVCRLAGLPTANAYIYYLNNSICSLMIERFDITPLGGRYEMVTINSLLKDPNTQCDALNFSYEDIADCIRKYSYQPREDLMQLYGQLLINQALSNTDDHLRNFSMIRDKSGWKMSPIYDVLPQHFHRGEHACTFNNSGFLPLLADYADTGRLLGLREKDYELVAGRVIDALSEWEYLLDWAELQDPRINNLLNITQNK
jgi:serine/threonine-protein kinase HipA